MPVLIKGGREHHFKDVKKMKGGIDVIAVTRLDDSTIFINVELIQSLQATPDTVITLVTKERMIVKESVDEVSKRICEYQRSIHNNPFAEAILYEDFPNRLQ